MYLHDMQKSLYMALFINISVSDTFRHILQHRKISHSIGAINHMSSNIAKKKFLDKN